MMELRNTTGVCAIIGLVLLLTALACSNQQELEAVEVDMGYEYFPLGIGRSWTYTVDSVVFVPDTEGIRQDSSRTLVREVLVDTTRSLSGELLYRGERYERKSDTLPWVFRKVFTLYRNERQAVRQEDNVPVVVLSFPNSLNASWSPAAYFDAATAFPVAGESVTIYEGWETVVVDRGTPFLLEDTTYTSTLSTENIFFESENIWREAQDRYAAGIGLVEREWRILDIVGCSACCDLDGDGQSSTIEEFDLCDSLTPIGRAERGFILHQRLIDYR
ncbi:MAG: hypothetical protein GVY26_11245 [Bacteroidetes bacterium]|jgi:hypothetical protein|nr:hypothetical protein [Bacteroidota bacterium]